MTKLTWKKSGIKYYDMVDDYVAAKFDDVSNYDQAMNAYHDLEKLTPDQISQQANNQDYDVTCFYRQVMDTAYKALWHFYAQSMGVSYEF